MVYSMIAFSRRAINGEYGNINWEIYSENRRHLEVLFRLPEKFRMLEPILRQRIRTHLTRGKIECSLRFEPNFDVPKDFVINKNLVKQLIKTANWIKIQSENIKINPIDILRWPGVIREEEKDLDLISSNIIKTFDLTVSDFIVAREKEGQALKILIEKRLDAISHEVKKIRSHMPEILKWHRERLLSKLKEAGIHLENNRLEQELILTAQRTDISEELDRIQIHIHETLNILNRKQSIGRHLDFIIQEMNRESNTLAAKSININITNSAIAIKVLIEQIREQIQNIE